MRGPTPTGPKMLLVEGNDEMHTLPKLLRRHVIWGTQKPEWPAVIKEFGGVEELLKQGTIAAELKAPGLEVVGVLVDADDDATGRFAAVARRIREAEPTFAGDLQKEGCIWHSTAGLRIGVWVMPDNAAKGMLESFLAHVVGPQNEELFALARAYVDDAISRGATCSEAHRDKACVHAYLATRDEPGKPLGIATAAGAFSGDNRLRRDFLAWFVELFEPTLLPSPGG